MEIDYLGLASRVLHILAAMTAVGGAVYVRFALAPAAEQLPEDAHAQLKESVRGRWSRVVMLCIALLLLSGIYNFFATNNLFKTATGETPGAYHMLFGVKFLLALVIFWIASALTGRTATTAKIREAYKTWLGVLIACAVAIVIISGVMRGMHIQPNPVAEAPIDSSDGD